MFIRESISFFELTEIMMHVISSIISSLLLEFRNWSSLYLAVIIFLEADHVSPDFSVFLGVTSLLHGPFGEIVGRGIELAAMRSLIDLEVDDFLVSINKMLIIILILQAVCKRILLDVASVLEFLVDKGEQIPDFVCFGPKVGLNLGKDKHSIDLDLKGSVPGEGDELLFGFIEVPFDFCIVGGAPAPVFGVMRLSLIHI